MKIAYFDCFAGISGDMVLGAVLDAGVDEARFRQELAKLPIEFDLQVSKVVKQGIQATDVRVIVPKEHHHRRLNDIKGLIEAADLSDAVKARSIAVFHRLAEAEGTVHGINPEEVTFHEVGAVDAIVDIVGSAIGLELLGIEEVCASPLPMGHGFVEAAHGKIPLPAPARISSAPSVSSTASRCRGFRCSRSRDIPVRQLTDEAPSRRIQGRSLEGHSTRLAMSAPNTH